MRARSVARLCLCLLATSLIGWPDQAPAQSDGSAVLLPPAPIPGLRSRPPAPRASFDAPNPVPRPVTDQHAALESDESAPVLPDTPDQPDRSDAAAQEPISAALQEEPRPQRRLLPPNPTPRSALPTHILAYGDDPRPADAPVPAEPGDLEEESAIVLPTTELTVDVDAGPACRQALAATGATFQPRGRVEGEGQCGIDDAVALQAIGGIRLQPAALVSCPTAVSFTAFVEETISPQARATMGAAPSIIYVAASYACRGRNNVPGARMSEHAFGRAVDVRALELEDGQNWHVRPHPADSDDPAALFQATVRGEACGPFNTVLGPGSDGHHGDHIHLDNARRSSTYCR